MQEKSFDPVRREYSDLPQAYSVFSFKETLTGRQITGSPALTGYRRDLADSLRRAVHLKCCLRSTPFLHNSVTGRWGCRFCHEEPTLSTETALIQHIRTAHPLLCPICAVVHVNAEHARLHVQREHSDRICPRPGCHYLGNLNNHIHHRGAKRGKSREKRGNSREEKQHSRDALYPLAYILNNLLTISN